MEADSEAPTVPLTPDQLYENQLASSRLGVASALFAALRASIRQRLRIACASRWVARPGPDALEMDETARGDLEIAALMHDIGKISVPDAVLLKPGPLTPEEAAIMRRRHLVALDILSNCCVSDQILEIIRHAPLWHDGNELSVPVPPAQLPLGARILAIVDAFDSMTTDSVYRRALSRERARRAVRRRWRPVRSGFGQGVQHRS